MAIYDAALVSLRRVESQYPRDRVVQNQIGRILFLKTRLQRSCQGTSGLSVGGPGRRPGALQLDACVSRARDRDAAEREQKLFLRFKADESSQSITAKPRLASPEVNNERQPIHDHEKRYRHPMKYLLAISIAVLFLAAAVPGGTGVRFTDVTAQAGIHFTHNAGKGRRKYLPETMAQAALSSMPMATAGSTSCW